MFRRLFELWRKEDLLHQALGDAEEMLRKAQKLFHMATAPLFFDEEVNGESIYALDREINALEIEIRRKVMEHLSVAPQQDTTAALVLTTITVDIERIGDYAKNFFELRELYGSSISDAPVFVKLRRVHDSISRMFDDTIAAFANADANVARRVMETHILNSKDCEEVIAALVRSPFSAENLAPNQEVLAALTARYLKRTSAHLKNIASSVVNPFDRIGFKPPEA